MVVTSGSASPQSCGGAPSRARCWEAALCQTLGPPTGHQPAAQAALEPPNAEQDTTRARTGQLGPADVGASLPGEATAGTGPPAATQAEQRVANSEEGVRRGFVQLDELDLRSELRRRVLTLQSVPLKADACRGWKLFFLAPGMLLYRSAGQAVSLPTKGGVLHLLREATGMRPEQGWGLPAAGDQAKAARATRLVQLGELSAAARVLTTEPLAPGTAETLAELRDPERRPPDIQVPCHLSYFLTSRQWLAPCPSLCCSAACGERAGGLLRAPPATNEHLRLLLNEPADCTLLHQVAERSANANVPEPVLAAIRLGRVVALRKPNGRVRALVVGDVFRRLVARALAQHFARRVPSPTNSGSARGPAPRASTSSSTLPQPWTHAPQSSLSMPLVLSTMFRAMQCWKACAPGLRLSHSFPSPGSSTAAPASTPG